VVAGTIMAGPYVRAAAQRHLNDLEGALRAAWCSIVQLHSARSASFQIC
jgi:hypothetical protein